MENSQLFLLCTANLGVLFFASCTSNKNPSNSVPEQKFKNVVFIVSDDHSTTTLGCYGNNKINTPNLDQLATEGVMFTKAYANAPLCSASRQSMLTGKYPHATGVSLLFTPFPNSINTTVAEYLKESGYKTAIMGKMHWNHYIWWSQWKDGNFPDHGFDLIIDGTEYKKHLKQNPPAIVPDSIETRDNSSKKNHSTRWHINADCLPEGKFDEDCNGTFLTNQAIQYMKKNKESPFCLWLAYHEPHSPFRFPVEFRDRHQPMDVELPKGSPEDDRWIPERYKNLTDADKKGVIAAYYTCVEYLDKNIGLVLDAIKDLGLEENTLVVYASDHGYLLYDHKRFEKHTMWEESVKAPLIVKGMHHFKKGAKSDALVDFIDIVPTVLEALGHNEKPEIQGKSFLPVLTGEKTTHKDFTFSEFLEDNKAMVANQEWKYIFTTGKRDLGQGYATGNGSSGIYHRLYNLKNDPVESKNLAYQAQYEKMVDSLQNVMLGIFQNTHRYADEIPQGLNKTGQLVWFCEPRDVGAEYGGKPLKVFTDEEFK